MTVMYESERTEILVAMDVFIMAKILHDEKFDIGSINHFATSNEVMFFIALEALSERYPLFKVRASDKEEKTLIFTVSLPPKLKGFYKQFKKEFKEQLESIEDYYGESYTRTHYNEIHAFFSYPISLHEIVSNLVNYLKRKEEELG